MAMVSSQKPRNNQSLALALKCSASTIVPELETNTTVLSRGVRHSRPSTPAGNQFRAESFKRA